MSDSNRKKSKFLSLILRHKPESIGLQLDANGWADINELIFKAQKNGMQYDRELVYRIVEESDKKRFKISDDKSKIRANQGHSVKVAVEMPVVKPPEILFHGTATKNLESILNTGLNSGSRLHVHLSSEIETAKKVGSRHGKVIVLRIEAGKMHNEGFAFYLSDNGVWLTDSVDKKYILSD